MKEGNVLFNDALDTFYFMVIWKEGRKCFIKRMKEGNVLFNNALNTFYLR